MKQHVYREEVARKMKYDYPEMYTKDDVKAILGFGRDKTNALFNSKSFPSTSIGNTKFILKKNFEEWLNNNAGRDIRL